MSFAERVRARALRLRWLAVPMCAYLAITLALPAANGALGRAEFVHHALWVVGACVAVIAIAVLAGAFLEVVRCRPWRSS